MSYTEKISNIKKQKNIDIIKIPFLDQIISLRVIDNSLETIKLSTMWRKNNLQWFHTEFSPTEEKSISSPKHAVCSKFGGTRSFCCKRINSAGLRPEQDQ